MLRKFLALGSEKEWFSYKKNVFYHTTAFPKNTPHVFHAWKQREKYRFHVFSTWNTRVVFEGLPL